MARKDDPVTIRYWQEQEAAKKKASEEGMNNLILALDHLNKAIESYRQAHVINVALQQIRDDLDEEIHALWGDDKVVDEDGN
jgi:molecular chaperone GrpE (heat shock protein)